MTTKRSTREIKEDLQRDREALATSLDTLLGRRKNGHALPESSVATESRGAPPLWTLAAGAGMGFLLVRNPLWPLRMVGRMMGVAAPIVVPMVVSYLKGRRDDAIARQ